jgi:2-polyprenyl-6-methoxyphenol hydroxylase-like FAD-dependent oxidoreductase
MTARKVKGQAVVIGGSLGGLFAARVLSARFDSVVILERDDLERSGEGRRGVPQGRHAHALLESGQNLIFDWFPGIGDELIDGGAEPVYPGRELYWHQGGGLRAEFPFDKSGPVCSRPFLEEAVRARVEKIDNVELRTGVHATQLTTTADKTQVTGVALEDDGTTLDAALVLDCTGRSGLSLKWIESLGYALPTVEEVGMDMRYTTRVFARDGAPIEGRKVAIEIGGMPEARLGACFPMEGKRWMVTLCGYHGDHAPSDDDGFLAYAKSLPGEFVARVVATCKPLSDFRTHRLPTGQRRRVDKMTVVPAGWALLGDAVASFNPIYGQGMSCAALQARSLGDVVDGHGVVDAELTRKIHKGAIKATKDAWALSTGGDLAHPKTTGKRPPGSALITRYVNRAAVAAHSDPVVAAQFSSVGNLMAPVASMLSPKIARRVLFAKS